MDDESAVDKFIIAYEDFLDGNLDKEPCPDALNPEERAEALSMIETARMERGLATLPDES